MQYKPPPELPEWVRFALGALLVTFVIPVAGLIFYLGLDDFFRGWF